jgi:orotidine-5'-phosphate decarboxylase
LNNKPKNPKDRIIVALDVDNVEDARRLVGLLKDHVGAFKVGFELFVAEGPRAAAAVTDAGAGLFLDLKFHDIPNTVAGAVKSALGMGATFIDVHASGGRAMMEAAANAAKSGTGTPPIMLAVTVLTSLDEGDLRRMNISNSPAEQVVTLARLAKESGMDGVVASPKEVTAIREAVGHDFVIVTPGVRPTWAATGDQKRVATPSDAVKSGADFLVIGRPITGAKDPVEAAMKIAEELAS